MNSPQDNITKNCKICGKLFSKRETISKKNWEKSLYCSKECAKKCNVGRKCPWAGKNLPWEVWNKGKKGVQVAWNKGIHYEQLMNNKHPLWKGNQASDTAKHEWVRRRLGRPSHCVFCGLNDPNRKYQWSNISGKYLRDINDYQRLCIPCHKKFDLERIKKNKQNGKQTTTTNQDR
jgi:hypothetical protein